jgi:hypothetical protein
MIQLRGPFAWFWAIWHLARIAGVFWGAWITYQFDLRPEVQLYFVVLYTVFLPVELLGAYRLRFNPPGVEIAKTLSQSNQWVAQQGRFGQHIALVSGALDVALVIAIVSPLSMLVALVAGGTLGWRLVAHYAWRADVG